MNIRFRHVTNGVALLISFATLFVVQTSGCSSSKSSGGPVAGRESFSNGGKVLTATTTTSTSNKTTTVNDKNGAPVVKVTTSKTGTSTAFPGVASASGTTDFTFRTPLTELPTDFTTNRMAVLVAGELATDPSVLVLPDDPGCDWFPDTNCTLGCCADHDKCYNDNGCGASSWIPLVGSDACKNCNRVAYDCITSACIGVTDSATNDRCYDHRCNEFYDCPDGKCDCTSPCVSVSPPTCGDGNCQMGENLSNCFADCGAGSSPSECCMSHQCPDETGSSCGTACALDCCCGANAACDWHVNPSAMQNICVTSND